MLLYSQDSVNSIKVNIRASEADVESIYTSSEPTTKEIVKYLLSFSFEKRYNHQSPSLKRKLIILGS